MTRFGTIAGYVLVDDQGQSWPVGQGLCRLGRDDDCAVRIEQAQVSRNHAEVCVAGSGLVIRDLGSANGTWVNDQRLEQTTEVPLRPGDRVRLGDWSAVCSQGLSRIPVPAAGQQVVIGRSESADFRVDDPQLSRRHAALRWEGQHLVLEDLGSVNGCFVEGRRIMQKVVSPGQQVLLGRQPYLIGQGESSRPAEGAVMLEGRGMWRCCPSPDGWRVILADADISLSTARMIAVVGPSGAGKSTLMNALIGFAPLDAGRVLFRGADVTLSPDALHAALGYVPQENAIHVDLTVRQVYEYAARLRLPSDHGEAERAERIGKTLGQLDLLHRLDTPVKKLSGGERKRANLGVELLTDPDIVALDEPTSGLDPGMERRLAEQLSELAAGGRLVIVITHAVSMMEAADELLYVVPGGRVAFQGPPSEARRAFGLATLADLFEPATVSKIQAAAPPRPAGAAPPATVSTPPPRVRQPLRQLGLLSQRYLSCLAGDARNLLLVILQAPFIGLLIAGLFNGPIFAATKQQVLDEVISPGDPLQVLFAVVLAALWIGLVNSAREIVKERAILQRERLAGIGFGPYLGSKFLVLGLISLAQMLILTFLVAPAVQIPAEQWLPMAGMLTLVALAGVGLGLLVSGLVRSPDQAMSLAVMLMIQQLLFAGVLLPLERMSGPLRLVADLTMLRWGLGGVCAEVELSSYLDRLGLGASVLRVMETNVGQAQVAMLVMTGLLLLVAWTIGSRRPTDERG